MADELLCQPADVLNAWPAFGQLPAGEQTALIATASQKILDFCRRGFALKTVTDLLDGKGLSRVWLTQKPVISVTSVSIGSDPPLDNTDGDAWYFVPGTGELGRGDGREDVRFANRFPTGRGNITVIYSAGYPAVPDPIIRATIWAVRWLREQTKISGIYSAERIGDYNYTLNAMAFSMTLPTHIAAMCANYVQDDGPL